jgi:ribonuclease HII
MKFEIPPQTRYPDLEQEKQLWQHGVVHTAGLDEAGRGAWAGPVYAAAVILPASETVLDQLSGVRDSKLMNARQRAEWAERIQQTVLSCAIGCASAAEIDAQGILPATRLAMRRAIESLSIPPQHLLIDAVKLRESTLPQTVLIKGDQRCLSIAAASVMAKTARDAIMAGYDSQFEGYGFAAHKGYGTRRHQRALDVLGACPIHRMSYKPIRAQLWQEDQSQPTD